MSDWLVCAAVFFTNGATCNDETIGEMFCCTGAVCFLIGIVMLGFEYFSTVKNWLVGVF